MNKRSTFLEQKLTRDAKYVIFSKLSNRTVFCLFSDNMTGRYCKNASEWPIFFAIVLQNIMADGMVNGQEDAVYFMTLECMLFISKMRDDSLLRS